MNRLHWRDPLNARKPMCGRRYEHPVFAGRHYQVSCAYCKKRMAAHFKPLGEAFIIMVTSYLRTLGAGPGPHYEWLVNTRLGPLDVSPRPDAIYCRFHDTKAAVTEFGHSAFSRLNPYSGKWNWMFDPGAGIEELHQFKGALDRLVPIG